jgi:hypothetical protein
MRLRLCAYDSKVLWLHRNAIVFQGASPSMDESLQLAVVSCEQWCRGRLVARSVLFRE